ncbi:MAG: DUF484 family protein, partial [Acidiferrobacterales bacterium]|nr:DUF484 family protein [Acidiferrobacterales bacterium]
AGQLHHFIVELMQVGYVEQLVELATEGLKSRFSLDYAVVRLFSENPDQPGAVFVTENNPIARQISDQVREGQSVSGVQFSPDEMNMLFGQDETPEGSLALIPVQSDRLVGLLVIGSSDPLRFGRDMATTYLDRIGELIAVTAMRLVPNQPGQPGQPGRTGK